MLGAQFDERSVEPSHEDRDPVSVSTVSVPQALLGWEKKNMKRMERVSGKRPTFGYNLVSLAAG